MNLFDAEEFQTHLIERFRGKPLFLIRFEKIEGMTTGQFIAFITNQAHSLLNSTDIEFIFNEDNGVIQMGLASDYTNNLVNIDGSVGRFHDQCVTDGICDFAFGIGRTQCNFISDAKEIMEELVRSSKQNLQDNLTRWSWTYFNRANSYIAGGQHEAMIQPTVYFDPRKKTFSVKGGEVFVGGGLYDSYKQLIRDIPAGQDINRIELLILEKLIVACSNAPGLLKFNVSPQSLIDTFCTQDRVSRLNKLLRTQGLRPEGVRFELVEKPYEETSHTLKDVCQLFYNHGISFAADDFGVKSQSHQVVLELGIMIKEFKLDPISFKFKVQEDQIKFLDNLAFIDYCKRLSDNREAAITAEAVEDYETLMFLMEHQVYQFQSNLFCSKMPVDRYRQTFYQMKDLPESCMEELIEERKTSKDVQSENIFELAQRRGFIG